MMMVALVLALLALLSSHLADVPRSRTADLSPYLRRACSVGGGRGDIGLRISFADHYDLSGKKSIRRHRRVARYAECL